MISKRIKIIVKINHNKNKTIYHLRNYYNKIKIN